MQAFRANSRQMWKNNRQKNASWRQKELKEFGPSSRMCYWSLQIRHVGAQKEDQSEKKLGGGMRTWQRQ